MGSQSKNHSKIDGILSSVELCTESITLNRIGFLLLRVTLSSTFKTKQDDEVLTRKHSWECISPPSQVI